MKNWSRRDVLSRLASLAVLASLPPAVLARVVSREPPVSAFGESSTAEQVTKGLGGSLVWPGLLRKLDRELPGYAS